jgi:methylamine dehydrogenase heavy chain
VFRHSILFDGDSGRMLGAIDSGPQITPKTPLWSRARKEIYNVDTIYSRGHRGERKDFVVIYDSRTLNVEGEIEIPPKTADTGTGIALVGILDGDRFVVALNQSPSSSVSVVDVETRRMVAEIQAAGCAAVFPAGPTRFGMLCGDGTAITVHLKENGDLDRIARSPPFFDVVADPIAEKGIRDGSTWWFPSFEGLLYEVDFGGDAPSPKTPWSLFNDEEREDGWRVGGAQHLAYHQRTKRLYSIVHEGGPGTHKEPGSEIWVYDLGARKKIDVFDAPNLIAAFLGPQAGFDPKGTLGKLLNFFLPNDGVHSITVTQDDEPLLFMRHADLGAVGVVDALSGQHLRDIEQAGLSGALLVVP